MTTKTFAEAYAMRSRHYQLLGEAGKLLADAYGQADLENQASIADNILEAMIHSLVEHHGYTRDEVTRRIKAELKGMCK